MRKNLSFFEAVKIIRALRADAFMDGKLPALFLADKGAGTVRASERKRLREPVFFGRKGRGGYLAQNLAFCAVVPVQVRFWGTAARAGAFIRDAAFLTAGNRLCFFAVAPFQARDVILDRLQ